MGKGEHCNKKKKERQQAACILCTLILVGLLILLLILYFTLFQPKDPKVQVPTMQLLSFNTQGNPTTISSVSFSLTLQISMYNPNRADFTIEDGSTACLYYQGLQIGFTSIPSGTISAQSFSTASVVLSVANPIELNTGLAAGVLPVTTSVTIIGHVTTANIFSHHSDVVSKCKVIVSMNYPSRAYIESYSCDKSFSIND